MTPHDAYHPRPADQRVYSPQRRRAIVGGLLLLAAAAGGVWLVQTRREVLIGWAVAMVFGGIGAAALLLGIFQRAAMVLGDEGLEIVGSRIGVIPWADVEQIVVTQVRQQRFLSLKLRDPSAYTARLGWARRTLAGVDHRLTGAHLTLPCHGLDASFDEILTDLQTRLEAWRSRHGGPTAPDPGDVETR